MGASELQHPRHQPLVRRTGPCLNTYANIGQGRRRPLPSLVAETAIRGIVGDDHMMMWDTDSDEIAGILLKVDRAARRE